MITIHPKSMVYKIHSLIANKNIGDKKNGMKEGDMKNCLILEMSDKERYAIFAHDWKDYFYVVMSTQEMHDCFNEQLQITTT